MSVRVCISASIGHYSKSGGQAMVYLSWALGLQALGCRIIWLEADQPERRTQPIAAYAAVVRQTLAEQGLHAVLAICARDGAPLPSDGSGCHLSLEEAGNAADLYLNLAYNSHPKVLQRFRRTIFVDTDPGLMQVWISSGRLVIPPHDLYFTIGETVGKPEARFPSCGLDWIYTRPPVPLSNWPVTAPTAGAPYTTVSNWRGQSLKMDGTLFENDKRSAFLNFADLPLLTRVPIELALTLVGEEDERDRRHFEALGWRVRSLADEEWTIERYRRYVQQSRGEFSCAKPMYVALQTAILHDRTLHYLASGKPAIVQHTGLSRFLPEAGGLFRFRTVEEARAALATVEADYEHQCRLARALAEAEFDAKTVLRGVLERCMG